MSKNDDTTDIEAWLAGAERPEGEIRISSKGKAVVQRAALRRQRNAAKDRTAGRMATPVDPELEKKIAALDKVIERGMRTFTLRGVDPDLYKELSETHRANGYLLDEHIVAAALVDPPMDQEQVHRLRVAVGQGQFTRLAAMAVDLSNAAEPSADF